GLLDAKLKTLPESPRQRAPQRGLPQMVDQVITRSLKTNPAERFQSAAAMRDALEAALREPELARQRRRRFGYAALGAVVAALVAGGVAVAKEPELAQRVTDKVAPVVEYVQKVRRGATPASAQTQAMPKATPKATSAKQLPKPVSEKVGAEVTTLAIEELEAEHVQDEALASTDTHVDIDLDEEAAQSDAEAGGLAVEEQQKATTE